MDAESALPEPQSYEQAMQELNTLVERMESGQLSLEDSLSGYRRGVALVQYCQQRLSETQQQVQILEGDLLRPFGSADTVKNEI